MKKAIVLIFLFIVSNGIGVLAQSIVGTVYDNLQEPVIFANVVLYSNQDSTIQKVETTNESGQFILGTNPGSYYIEISYIGLEDLKIPILVDSKDVELGQLVMKSGGIELETAVVTAQRALVEVKSDRTVFNVEGTINSTCLLYTSPSPRDQRGSRMPSSA